MEEGNANLGNGHMYQEGKTNSHSVSFPGKEARQAVFRIRYCGP